MRINDQVLVVRELRGGWGYHVATLVGKTTSPQGCLFLVTWFDRFGYMEEWYPENHVFLHEKDAESRAAELNRGGK